MMILAMRGAIGVTAGLATFLVGQVAIENTAWWLTGGMGTFDEPLFNAVRFGIAGAVGLMVGAAVGFAPLRNARRRL